MPDPVLMDIITPLPESLGICVSCEAFMAQANMDKPPQERDLDDYPPDWQEDFQRLSDIVVELAVRYNDTLLIRLFDPRSLQGLWKSIRYGVHRYPTFVIVGHQKVTGWDISKLENALQAVGITPKPAKIDFQT